MGPPFVTDLCFRWSARRSTPYVVREHLERAASPYRPCSALAAEGGSSWLPRCHGTAQVFAGAADARRPTLSGISIRDPGPGGDTPAQVAAGTRAEFRLLAERLARDLAGHVVRFRPGPSLTALAEWF